MALTAKEFRHTKVHANGFGVPNVDVAIRFGREARDHEPARTPFGDIFFNPLPQKVT